MKHLILVLLISTSILTTTHLETKTEHHDRLRIQDNLHLSTDSDNGAVHFVLGDSLATIQEANRVREEAEKRRIEASNKRSQTTSGQGAGGYGQSYTGGQAEVIGYSNEQCVTYAKRKAGISRSIGYAGTATVQGNELRVGAIGIEKSKVGHAVFIEAVEGDKVVITEANYYAGKITRRILSINSFRGFIYN